MNEFPKMLYKYPGTVLLQDGYYATVTVRDETEEQGAIGEGYAPTPAAARDAEAASRSPPRPPSPEAPEAPAPVGKGKWG